MHDRLAADPRQLDAANGGVLAAAALVSVAVSPVAVATIQITGIVIIRPSAGGVSDS